MHTLFVELCCVAHNPLSFKNEGGMSKDPFPLNVSTVMNILHAYTALPYSHVSVEHEIACVDAKALEGGSGTSHVCAIGLWTDISARVLRLPSLDTLYTQPLGGGDAKPAHLLYMCIQFFFFLRVYTYTLYVHVHVHACAYMQVHVYTCIYVYMYMCTMYMCTVPLQIYCLGPFSWLHSVVMFIFWLPWVMGRCTTTRWMLNQVYNVDRVHAVVYTQIYMQVYMHTGMYMYNSNTIQLI